MKNSMIKISQEAIDFVFGSNALCKKIKNPKKARKICEMRLAGSTYIEIGKKVKLSPDTCRRVVQKTSIWHKTLT